MTIVFGPLLRGETYRRWAYLIVGGALLVPYLLVGMFALPAVLPPAVTVSGEGGFLALILVFIVAVMVLTSFIPAVRVLEGTAARELLRGRLVEWTIGAERTWSARWRATAWFVLHIVAGGAVSAATLVLPPIAVVACTMPFLSEVSVVGIRLHGPTGWSAAWLPIAALLGLVALVYAVAATGAGLAGLAPVFLGPSATERLAQVRRRAERLAERNRLARELHDSVGHALSVVSIQAGAAGRVLDTDPAFARRALAAIEDSARDALADLDHVLGLLRDDHDTEPGDPPAPDTLADPPRAPQPTLKDLPALLDRTRLAGLLVAARTDGDLATVPSVVSREAYRIVQEALTNVLRHAGRVPTELRLRVGTDDLEVSVANPLGTGVIGAGRGGRGLRGLRERTTVLRGRLTAGADGDRWLLTVVLPLRAGRDRDTA